MDNGNPAVPYGFHHVGANLQEEKSDCSSRLAAFLEEVAFSEFTAESSVFRPVFWTG